MTPDARTMDGASTAAPPGGLALPDRPWASPAAEVAGRDEAARLREALSTLPEDEREIVLLREGEGLTFREVCETTGLTRDTVRWRLARGMERLRKALGAPAGREVGHEAAVGSS